ncbi:hypothetical protein HK102_008794, partial [Quaeritorhiza haematococci]
METTWPPDPMIGEVAIIDLSTEKIQMMAEHVNSVLCLALSGPYLFTGGADCSIVLSDWKSARRLDVLVGHYGKIIALQTQKDLLLSASLDQKVKLWRITSTSTSSTASQASARPTCECLGTFEFPGLQSLYLLERRIIVATARGNDYPLQRSRISSYEISINTAGTLKADTDGEAGDMAVLVRSTKMDIAGRIPFLAANHLGFVALSEIVSGNHQPFVVIRGRRCGGGGGESTDVGICDGKRSRKKKVLFPITMSSSSTHRADAATKVKATKVTVEKGGAEDLEALGHMYFGGPNYVLTTMCMDEDRLVLG